MSDCCSSSCSTQKAATKHCCPECGIECSHVSISTIKYQIRQPWNWLDKEQIYYFCNAPNCNVVYFGDDNSIIFKSELRTEVGIKNKTPNSILCYCFGITVSDLENNTEIKSYVIQQTKEKVCACETHNPSGRCCLKDFPK